MVDGPDKRSVHDCFIKPAKKPSLEVAKNREFTALDIFPTTLLEEYGLERLNRAFPFTTPYYVRPFLEGKQEEPKDWH